MPGYALPSPSWDGILSHSDRAGCALQLDDYWGLVRCQPWRVGLCPDPRYLRKQVLRDIIPLLTFEEGCEQVLL